MRIIAVPIAAFFAGVATLHVTGSGDTALKVGLGALIAGALWLLIMLIWLAAGRKRASHRPVPRKSAGHAD